jgi:hypothetical protein
MHMRAEELVELLGRRQTDPAVEAALVHFAVRNRPEVRVDEDDADGPVVDTQSWVKNSKAGIEFGFNDEAAWLGRDETEFGEWPMLLTQVYFYGHHEGVHPYAGSLPFGLTLDDDRATVRAKMMSLDATRHSHSRDTWDAQGFRVTVGYDAGQTAIEFVLCMLREPDLPPLGYALAPVPTAQTIMALLSQPLDSSAVVQAFGPLGLQGRHEEIEDTGEADLRVPYGLTLGFSEPLDVQPGRGRMPLVLSHVTFYRERELDAREWPGDLPQGVSFEDSPEMVVRKIGQPPDIQVDDQFSGYGLWHLGEHDFHVFYSTMENRLMRVSLFAPGYWDKWHEI